MAALKTVGRNDDLASGNAVHHAGFVMGHGRSASDIPAGWLPCDGRLVPQATYTALFAEIGHAFNGGADPGGGRFRLPGLQASDGVGSPDSPNGQARMPVGRFSGGTPGTLGSTAGAPTHTHASSLSAPNHHHYPGSLVVVRHWHGHNFAAPHIHFIPSSSVPIYNPLNDSPGGIIGDDGVTNTRLASAVAGDIAGGIADTTPTVSGQTADASAGVSGSTAAATPAYQAIRFIIKT